MAEKRDSDLHDRDLIAQTEEDSQTFSEYSQLSVKDKDLDATRMYLKEIGFSPLLTAEEEIHYSRLALQGDEQARNKMVESNLRLVVKVARHYINRGIAFLDLIEEGNLGLIHAVGKFDPERGFRFSTYATWWIRQSIERCIMNQSRMIRLPVHIVKELNVYLRAGRQIEKEMGREASAEEIAQKLDKPLNEVKKIIGANDVVISADHPVGQNNDQPLVDLLTQEGDDPEGMLIDDDLLEFLGGWIAKLNDKHRVVLERRFGLNGHEKETLKAIGSATGFTRERVRQLQIEALDQLRQHLENHDLSMDIVFDSQKNNS